MTEEIFVPIIGYEGLYEISNFGNVKSLRYNKMLKHTKYKGGIYVSLLLNKKTKLIGVHRLIAIHFIENPNKYNQIRFKNGDKTDIRVENLEWYDFYNDNCCKNNAYNFKGSIKVIDNKGILIGIINGKKEMNLCGFKHSAVYDVVNKKINKYKGFVFERSEEYIESNLKNLL